MTKVMAKCVWSKREDVRAIGDMVEVIEENDWSFKYHEGGASWLPWDGVVFGFERIEVDHPPTTIEEMLGVVEAAGADSAVSATQALHAAGYHK